PPRRPAPPRRRRAAPPRRPGLPDPRMSSDAARASPGADPIAESAPSTRRRRREWPWDRAQDERSIVPHTVEEAYELADAAAAGDPAKVLDEAGDALFHVHCARH